MQDRYEIAVGLLRFHIVGVLETLSLELEHISERDSGVFVDWQYTKIVEKLWCVEPRTKLNEQLVGAFLTKIAVLLNSWGTCLRGEAND